MHARLHAYVSSQVRQIGASSPASKWSTSRPLLTASAGMDRVLHHHAGTRERLQRPAVRRHLLLGDAGLAAGGKRSEEHTSELQSRQYLVCRLLLEKKKKIHKKLSRLQSKSKKGATKSKKYEA